MSDRRRRETVEITDVDVIRASRAPALTLWASVVAEGPGDPAATALALGRAAAGS